jgi:hypothetical protein
MEKPIIPIAMAIAFFMITIVFVKWLNGRVKATPASELIYKIGVLWDKKKKPFIAEQHTE